MVITIRFLHPVVDVSAQSSCTVTPLNPATLTATGGVLVNGIMDVRIQCVCTVTIDQRVRWYDPKVTFIVGQRHSHHMAGSPYIIRDNINNITLVIPIFNDSYDGTYYCGIRVNDNQFTSPSAAVTLTITSELMINTVSYLYVATCIVTLSS